MSSVEGDLLVLSSDELSGLIPLHEIIATVEEAARALAEGRALAPKRQHIDWNGNTLLTMPAVSGAAVGVKLVSVVPDNSDRGLPVTNGIMVLNDHQTGLPISLLNAASLTALRTGAVGALGVKYLTPENQASVGIVGCGVQGAWQAIFACIVRPVREIYCACRSPASFRRFVATVSAHVPQANIIACKSARHLLERTELIIAATTSSDPVLPDEPSLLERKHFVSVGSFRPDMQELPDAVYRLAGKLIVDSQAARHEAGDVIRCLDTGMVESSNVIFIGQLITGQRSIDVTNTTAYKTVGMALYDLCVAQALYLAAVRNHIGREITL